MKHNNKSKKHYNIKNNIKKRIKKTKKRKMKHGGGLFSSMSFGIPGFGSAGTCPDKQIYENGEWKTQTCYEFNGNKVYKTVENGAATGSNTKSWYFW